MRNLEDVKVCGHFNIIRDNLTGKIIKIAGPKEKLPESFSPEWVANHLLGYGEMYLQDESLEFLRRVVLCVRENGLDAVTEVLNLAESPESLILLNRFLRSTKVHEPETLKFVLEFIDEFSGEDLNTAMQNFRAVRTSRPDRGQ